MYRLEKDMIPLTDDHQTLIIRHQHVWGSFAHETVKSIFIFVQHITGFRIIILHLVGLNIEYGLWNDGG